MTNPNIATFSVFAILAAFMFSAASATAAPDQPTSVMVDVRLVQLNEPLLEVSLSGSQMIVNHQSTGHRPTAPDADARSGDQARDDSAITITASPPGNSNDPGVSVISITDDATLKFGQSVLRLSRNNFLEAADAHLGQPVPWEVMAAPRIIAEVGQQAGIEIGAAIPYMVKNEDGSLVVEYAEDVREGVAIELTVDQAGQGLVSFKQFSVEVNRIASRQPIPDVPFDVGRPIVRSMKISTALTLATDHVAIIQLPRATEDNPPVLIFLRARDINRD